jgi:hypothetical protein
MTKRAIPIISVLVCMLLARTFAQPTLQDTAQKLFSSLTEDQKKDALLPFDSPERNSMVFPGGKRPGIQIKSLTPDQQKLAGELITRFTSDYGKQKVHAIADQKSNLPDDPTTGLGRYYLCFFGDPTRDKTYAWRIAEHHLTLVHVEIADGKATSFGPILLGANPPDLWDTEEEKMIALYAALTPDERARCTNPGKSNSSEPAKPNTKTIRLSDLNPSAKAAADEIVNQRLSFFAEDIQQRIRAMIEKSAAPETLQIAFYRPAEKKCREGGRWDFKLFNDSFLCDYEGSRAHIHLSLKCNTKQ